MSGINKSKKLGYKKVICTAAISADKIIWNEIEIIDISSRGLEFFSAKVYNLGEIMNFDLCVYSVVLSAFNIALEGCIVDREDSVRGHYYEVEFYNLDKKISDQLDEIINANSPSKNFSNTIVEGGLYSFILNPKGKTIDC